MAIRKAGETKVDMSGVVVTKQVPPSFKSTVVARVRESSFGPSNSSGLPQITLKCEILIPERILSDIDGKQYDLTSTPFTIWLSLSEKDKNGDPSNNLDYFVNELLPRLGLPGEVDDENPLKSSSNPNGIQFDGMLLEVLLSSKERKETRKNPVTGKYEVVKDSRDREITKGWEWNMIDKTDILGLATMGQAVEASDNRPV